MGFEFVHKKKVLISNEQNGGFLFTPKKRLDTITHPSQGGSIIGGAFSNAFDSNSFWVGISSVVSRVMDNINSFMFCHTKRQ